MGQALYRKYRSKSLDEIVGQEHITETLGKALKSGRISHAYLFTGPRGVGKTSIARILAHQINGIPYDETQTHMDIIEIDAASNRRIDEIRDLRDKVYIAPTSAKYKVYIIDEAHMLTREAFNALLKTLEEPPAHAVFILATTESHKLPETIISRTQRFVFRPIDPDKAVAHLHYIAAKEKIPISDDALEFIARHAGGSFRDSIGLLDQAANSPDKIDLASVQSMLGIPPLEATNELLAAINSGAGISAVIQLLNQLSEQGFQAAAIAKQIATQLRQQLLDGTSSDPETALTTLSKLLEVPVAHDPERYLEIILLSLASQSKNNPVAAPVLSSEDTTSDEKVQTPAKKSTPHPRKQAIELKTEEIIAEPAIPKVNKESATSATDSDVWPQLLASLKSKHNTLYGIVRMAKPDFSVPHELTLTFAFAFHQKRMNESKNQQIVGKALLEITGSDIVIRCELDPGLKLTEKKPATELPKLSEPIKSANEPLEAISNIFGGGELLQS